MRKNERMCYTDHPFPGHTNVRPPIKYHRKGGTMDDISTTVEASNDWPATNPHVFEVGTKIGPWIIEALIATGGHGAIYRVRHTETHLISAIKILHPSLSLVPRMVERFLREITVILHLDHPNIVQILDVGALPDNTPYYAMEYLEGKTLRTLLDEKGRLGNTEILTWLEPICGALEVAHAKGIVHRDVKASNIMMTRDVPPRVKLLDFGIAKLLESNERGVGLTSAGQQVGTPSVMAPEQILGGPIDARTDIYALGALLYQMLTGRKPFESKTPSGLIQLHLQVPPPRPSERVPIAPAFDTIVTRCMDKRPQNRYSTAGAFLDALRQAVHGSTTAAPSSDDCYAIGLFVDIRPRALPNMDDETFDSIADRTLERVTEHLRHGGLIIALSTNNTILGIQLLGTDPNHSRPKRHAVLDLARTVRAKFVRDPSVHINVTLHVDRVTVSHLENGEPEITSGVLARTETWAPIDVTHGLCATPEFVGGLGGLELEPGPHGLFVVAASLDSSLTAKDMATS